jgi:hypothetical protein
LSAPAVDDEKIKPEALVEHSLIWTGFLASAPRAPRPASALCRRSCR